MRYLLLIYSDESYYATVTEAQMGELMQAYGTFTEELAGSGAMVDAARLRPTPTATTVRVRDGKAQTTDGPFTETKETLGGYYLINAENLDEAIAWAAKIPTAAYGSVEVRPIWEDGEE